MPAGHPGWAAAAGTGRGPPATRSALFAASAETGLPPPRRLNRLPLVELSGGSYESPAMSGRPADTRTRAREACFLDLAKDLAAASPLPLMLTGGITRRGGGARRRTDGCGR